MLLRKVPPALYHPPTVGRVSLRFLGTAGFVVEGAGRTLVLDPYLSRPGLWATALRPLASDLDLVARAVPRADDVLVGHAHMDHILDAPAVCLRTGARFIGGPGACRVARAAGVPEAQVRETLGREAIAAGSATVRGLPSRHGKAVLGRVPLPGRIAETVRWPARFWELRHDLVLNWHVEVGGQRVVHVDSADFVDGELADLRADVLCLCAIGRQHRPRYVEDAVALLRPRWVVACHWDWFFSPYGSEPRQLPGVDLEGFVDEIRAAGATPVVLPPDGSFSLGG